MAKNFLASHAQHARAASGTSAAFDRQNIPMPAIGVQMGRKQAPILVGAGALTGAQQHGPGAVAKQHAGTAIGPIQDTGIDLSADHQHVAGMARAHHRFSNGKPIDETGTRRGDVKGKAGASADLGLHARGGGGKAGIGRGGGNDNAIYLRRRQASIGQGSARGGGSQIRSRFVRRGDMAKLDPCAFLNPGVRGFKPVTRRQFIIGKPQRGKVAAATGDQSTHDHGAKLHQVGEGASLLRPASRSNPSRMRSL